MSDQHEQSALTFIDQIACMSDRELRANYLVAGEAGDPWADSWRQRAKSGESIFDEPHPACGKRRWGSIVGIGRKGQGSNPRHARIVAAIPLCLLRDPFLPR